MWLWDCNIKGTLCQKCVKNNGFIPAQGAFESTNLPNFLENKLPAQESSVSPDIASHISALHAEICLKIFKLKLVVRWNIGKSGADSA